MKIKLRSFGEWRDINSLSALLWARVMFDTITNIPDEQERVKHINTRLKGIQFTLEDLREQNEN